MRCTGGRRPILARSTDLDLSQAFERPALEAYGLNTSAGRSPAVEFGVIGRSREKQNDQVDCSCWLRLGGCGIGASDDPRADYSSAGRHDHESRCGLRRGQDTGQRCVRGKNNRPSDPPSRPQMCDRNDLLALVLQWRPRNRERRTTYIRRRTAKATLSSE